MFTRRAALISAAATALMLATPAFAASDLNLPRQKVELVPPPSDSPGEAFTDTEEVMKKLIPSHGTRGLLKSSARTSESPAHQ